MDTKAREAVVHRLKFSEREEKYGDQKEEALRQGEEVFRAFADATTDIIHLTDGSGRIVFANRATERLLGYPVKDLRGVSVLDLVHPDDRHIIRTDMSRLVGGQNVASREILLRKTNGRSLRCEVNSFLVLPGGYGPYVAFVIRDATFRRHTESKLGQYRNLLEKRVREQTADLIRANKQLRHEISERKRTEEALRESEERYRDLFENATDLIQIVRPDGRYEFVNRAWKETFGYTDEEVSNLSIFDLIHPDCRGRCADMFQRVLTEGKIEKIETVFLAKDGRKVMAEGSANCRVVDGKPVSARCVFRDVTETKRLERQLLEAKKLESVAALAGGIAHDFNNLLTGILGNISLAMMSAEPDTATQRALNSAEKASLQASHLVQQLVTFSRGGAPEKSEADIVNLVREATAFTLRGSDVTSEVAVADKVWTVEIDVEQMRQAIEGLVRNAMEAMPEGGVVRVSIGNTTVAPAGCPKARNANFVVVAIEDHGMGISQRNLSRIFDPYFTTKQMGYSKGTGLGLALCHSIVTSHKGFIEVDSSPGAGTTFRVYLPAIPAVQQLITAADPGAHSEPGDGAA